MHDGAVALSQVEAAGIRIDVAYLDRTIARVEKRIGHLTKRLKLDDIYGTWKKTYGAKASLGSRAQLAKVLFDVMKLPCGSYTEKKKRPQANEENLRRLNLPFVGQYLEVEKLKKLLSTYLRGVRREVVGGYLRPSFNLHLVKTYRSSCDTPNFQNIPIRDKLVGKLIRRCFVPRDGHVLVEMDYGGHEFRVAACFWRDEAMVKYASDPGKDIHRDMAAECYALPVEQVTSDVRFFTKNQFVFPQLYGSYYVTCARNLWNVIESAELKTKDGTPLKEHLAGVWDYPEGDGSGGLAGIDDSNFEDHIKRVEGRFNERFPTWSGRKEQWWSRYQKRGWFPLMTGFRCGGVYSRNQVFNTPVQGPAFHCLLWSLIRLVRRMRKGKMRSKVVGQIHDSIIADVHRNELDDYLGMARRIMAENVRKAWSWIIVPLEVDAAVAEENWFEKREVEL